MLGVNASYPIAEKLTGTFGVVNGYWHLAHANDVPSLVAQVAYKASDRVSVKETVLYGSHQPTTTLEFWRVLSDTIVERKSDRLTAAFEYQLASEKVDAPTTSRALWMSAQLPVHRRRGLIEALGKLVEQHVLRAFSQSVTLADYQAVNAEYAFSEAAAGLYGVCAASVMASVRQWMAAKHPDDLTLFISEQGDIDQRELHRILKAEQAEAGEPPQIWPRQWLDERGRHRYLRPLEACGLFGADRDGVFVKRLSERSLLESHVIDREHLVQIRDALEITPRSENATR